MMAATVDGYMRRKNKTGYHALIVCPVNLPIKWKEEILKLIPNAEVHVINETTKIPLLIKYHSRWVREGRIKPTRPIFFVATYSTMKFQYEETYGGQLKTFRTKEGIEQTRFSCPLCGEYCGKKVKDGKEYFDENGKIRQDYKVELFENVKEVMNKNSCNVFCSNCGQYMFGPAVVTRRKNFSDWNTNVAEPLVKAIDKKDRYSVKRIMEEERNRERQNYYKSGEKLSFGKIGNATYRESLANYVRHRMNKFFDMTIIDEIHNVKSLTTGQGIASGKIIARSKKVLGGTGTLLGGLATDVFSILFRFFPKLILSDGFNHNSVNKWGNVYGNIERIVMHAGGYEGYQKLAGGKEVIEQSPKSVPGISPLVFAKFLLQNTVNVRLLDVWETPTDLIEIPTILCPMSSEQKEMYELFVKAYESAASQYKRGAIRGMVELAYVKAGVTLPDLMTKHPDVNITLKGSNKANSLIKIFETNGKHISEEIITPKEKKLVDIIGTERSLKRPVILFVTSTGSEKNPTMDLRTRLCDVLKRHGIKTVVMRRDSCKINERTQWMMERIIDDGYEVIICNMSLVKEGVDLIFAPTIIFYQFHWSMFVIAQSARRAWRINQTRECRIFYLATEDTMQEKMALLVAKKARASDVINGEASSGGLSAMLGDDGDLMGQLLKEIRTGENSSDFTKRYFEHRDEAAEKIYQQIGCTLVPIDEILDPRTIKSVTSDFVEDNKELHDEIAEDEWNIFTMFGLGNDSDATSAPVAELVLIENEVVNKNRKTIGQLSFDLFGEMEEI